MTSFSAHGPIFDHRADVAARDFADDAEDHIAQRAYTAVEQELSHVLRHPTGYYQSQLQVDHLGSAAVVNDGGVVYGPWLEGVGSRNATTRFKGYAHWRRIGQRIDRSAEALAEEILPRYLRRMN